MRQTFVLLSIAVLLSSPALSAVIDFEGLPDNTAIGGQYPGLQFSNASVLSAGISLNEFEFPPKSGVNVLVDDAGMITIAFFGALPISVGGYFTYLTPVTLAAIDAADNIVDSATSIFDNNLALSGDNSSVPNEFLQVSYSPGISSVRLLGDPAGASFSLDDLVVTYVPEPSLGLGVACVIVVFTSARIARKRTRNSPVQNIQTNNCGHSGGSLCAHSIRPD